jgi:ribose 5-phosphate isomerase B
MVNNNIITTIYIASDHAGYEMKQKIIKRFRKQYQFIDLGTNSKNVSVDYPTFAKKVALAVLAKNAFGILICGTGYGMCIAANKIKGIRAVNIDSLKMSTLAIYHNNINVVCLSARYVSFFKNVRILKKIFKTSYSGEKRHQHRLDIIKELENNQ